VPASRAAGQQAESIVEPFQQRLGREQLDPRGGQLDRQWQAIQPPADLRQRRRILGRQREICLRRSRPLDE
jgi:hypothetical protein